MAAGPAHANPSEPDHEHSQDRANRNNHPGWHRQRGEYPWRITRTLPGDDNWRGTWTLEVKNLFDVEWDNVKVFDGRKWRLQSLPHVHWPFPYEKAGSPANKDVQGREDTTEGETKGGGSASQSK